MSFDSWFLLGIMGIGLLGGVIIGIYNVHDDDNWNLPLR